MPTLFEYNIAMRTSRETSGHEAEELHDVLNEAGAVGWQLKFIIEKSGQQILIFERDKL